MMTIRRTRAAFLALVPFTAMLLLAALPVLHAEEPAAAAAQPKTEDYITLVDVRVNKLQKSMDDFKAFLEHGVPMVAPMVMGEAYSMVVHTGNLNGLDGARAAHTIAYIPKNVFKLTPEQLAEANVEPVLVEYIPLKDGKVYLDKMGEEIDEFVKDGNYEKFVNKKDNKEVFFKIAGKYALFSNSKAGIDVGVARGDALAAADEKSTDTASLTIEILPQDLLKAAGLTDPAERKKSLAAFEAFALETMKEAPGGLGRMGSAVGANDLHKAMQFAMDLGDRCDLSQVRVNFTADAVSMGVKVHALDGSDVAKALAGVKKIDPAKIHVPAGVKPIVITSGSINAGLNELTTTLLQSVPEAQRKNLQIMLDLQKKFEGQQVNMVLGMQGTMDGGMGGEVQGAAGTDAAAAVDAGLKTMKELAELEKNEEGQPEVTMEIGEFKAGADGWKQRDVSIQAQFQAPLYLTILVKDAQMVFGGSTSQLNAEANAKDMAAAKNEAKFNPEFAAYLKKSTDDRNGIAMFCIDPKVVSGSLAGFGLDAGTIKAIDDMLAKVNPAVFQVFVNGTTVEIELRVEAEAIKQYTSAVMQVITAMNGARQGNVPPPPPGDF